MGYLCQQNSHNCPNRKLNAAEKIVRNIKIYEYITNYLVSKDKIQTKLVVFQVQEFQKKIMGPVACNFPKSILTIE